MARLSQIMVWVAGVCLAAGVQGASLTGIDFAALPGDGTEIRMTFDGAPPEPKGYSIEQPARIALDLVGVTSGLSAKQFPVSKGNTQGVTVIEASGRTRVIVNLLELVPYATEVSGSQLLVRVGGDGVQAATVQTTAQPEATTASSSSAASARGNNITEVDFQRGEKGDGRVIVRLGNAKVGVDMSEEAGNVRLTFKGVALPEELRRRLDVTDFATPVRLIDAFVEEGNAVILVKPTGNFDYLAYQTDNEFTLSVEPLTEEEVEDRRKDKFPYSGEKLSLNFQDIEVRSVLQLIADFTGLNLVASDTVGGRITLRLQNVPWDQALELVLKTKGLDQRQVGNVLLVAPTEEIAAREKLELEASKQVKELAPVRLEVIQINYAKASEIVDLLKQDAELVSTRGFISSDQRTNTISIRETADKIAQVRRLIQTWDVPVSQVLIEARIVRASTDAVQDLGVSWGGSGADFKGGGGFLYGGSTDAVSSRADTVGIDSNGNLGRAEAVDFNFPRDLAIDLGVTRTNSSSFAIGYTRNNLLLDLELSAFESDGKGEIVAQPKVVTADRKKALIEAGEEIPYQEASSSGATTVSFKKAVLSLEVTPQITPDNKIIMDLKVNQDSRGEVTAGIPSIVTNKVETQVLVGNGETVVLGGIFTSQVSETVTKTPFLGDIPYLGALFRKTESTDERSELLVFITPKLIRSGLIED